MNSGSLVSYVLVNKFKKVSLQFLISEFLICGFYCIHSGLNIMLLTFTSMSPTFAVDLIIGLPTMEGKMCDGKLDPA